MAAPRERQAPTFRNAADDRPARGPPLPAHPGCCDRRGHGLDHRGGCGHHAHHAHPARRAPRLPAGDRPRPPASPRRPSPDDGSELTGAAGGFVGTRSMRGLKFGSTSTTPILGTSVAAGGTRPPRDPRRKRALRAGIPPGVGDGALYGGGGAEEAGIGMSSSSGSCGSGAGAGGSASASTCSSDSLASIGGLDLNKPNALPNENPLFFSD